MRSHPLFSTLKIDPYDVDQALTDDTPQREAKRRRIEIVANQYLAGSAPFILSATLRGPFDASWKNPWAKRKSQFPNPSSRPTASSSTNRRRARHATREASSRPNQLEEPPTINPRQRERQARAEAERAESDKRRAKEERREHRRQQQRKRQERATELLKDGLGKSPLKPVDLTVGASIEAEYATSKDYGSREIRSSFTDEWLSRLGPGSGSKTPELSPVQTTGFGTQVDELEATTPTRPRKRSKFDQDATNGQAKFISRPQSERHRSLVPERDPPNPVGNADPVPPSSNRYDNKGSKKRLRAVPRPRRDVAPEVARRQYSLSTKPISSTAAGSRTYDEQRAALDRPAAEVSRALSMQVSKNENMLQGPALLSTRGGHTDVPENPQVDKTDSGYDAAYRKVSNRPTGRQHRRLPSGFTPINPRFSSPPAGHPEPALSTTPAGRPVLGVKSTTNSANPADAIGSSLQPRNEGVIVMSANDIRFQGSPMKALVKALEGQENNPHDQVTNENKNLGYSHLKRPLVQSAEKCGASALGKRKKLKKTHPLQASPTAINSPGFAYRKVSDPTENMPGLPSTGQLTKRSVARKRSVRLMTFGSIPTESDDAPVFGPPIEDELAVGAEAGGELLEKSALDGQKDKNSQASPVRDLSTQAAIHFAQQEFQQEFRSPLKDRLAMSPEKDASSQQTRTTTPPRSQLPREYTAVTPFKDFNKGRLFLADNPHKLTSVAASTQELLNAASPFAFSTVKKNKDRRKRVSMAASPLKVAEDMDTERPPGVNELAAQIGVEGDTTVAELTMAYQSTTPPTPKVPSFARDQPPGLKSQSLNPTLTSSLKKNTTRFISGSRNLSQARSSFPRLDQPPSSAPVTSGTSRPLHFEARGGQSQSQVQSQSSRRSCLKPAQRQTVLDDVDLDSAMDAADSFLESWDISADLRNMAPAGSASKA